jgi:hypothetical protein
MMQLHTTTWNLDLIYHSGVTAAWTVRSYHSITLQASEC